MILTYAAYMPASNWTNQWLKRQQLTLDGRWTTSPVSRLLPKGLHGFFGGRLNWASSILSPAFGARGRLPTLRSKSDPKSAMAHAVLGHIYAQDEWNWGASAQECAIALSLAPNDPLVLWFAASERLAVGAWEDASRYIDAGLMTDPLDPVMHQLAGTLYIRVARFSDAENEYRRALEIAPTFAFAHSSLA